MRRYHIFWPFLPKSFKNMSYRGISRHYPRTLHQIYHNMTYRGTYPRTLHQICHYMTYRGTYPKTLHQIYHNMTYRDTFLRPCTKYASKPHFRERRVKTRHELNFITTEHLPNTYRPTLLPEVLFLCQK